MANVSYIGEFLSLLTAVIWATAVIFFKRSGDTVHPLALNLFKNLLATICFLITMVILQTPLLRDVPARDYLLLLISGAIGIGVADTMFFKSLNILGAGLSAIVECLYSPITIIFSIWWLSETLTMWQSFGVILIMLAVLAATQRSSLREITPKELVVGLIWGVLGMMFMAIGVVMIKPILARTSLLWVTEIRLIGGVLLILVILAFHKSRRVIIQTLLDSPDWRFILPGSFIGAYLAMITWLAGVKLTTASAASALNQTSNIFIFIFAFVFLKEQLTVQKVTGIVLAMVGVFMVTFGKV